MLYSAEVRWFYQFPNDGLTEERLQAWFNSESLVPIDPEVRVDRYLVFPGCESVGIKLRDIDDPKGGKFEVKAALGAPEVMSFPLRVRGRADTWVKWTFDTKDFAPWVAFITAGRGAETTWVSVDKRRLLRKYSLDRVLEEVSPKDRPDKGCNVELVSLALDQSLWWTFGFESFGERAEVRSILQEVATHWFKRDAPVALDVTRSVAYPTWAGNFV